MIVGVCRVELALPGNDSLKGKRRVKRSLADRARRKFGLSVAEVDKHESLSLLVIGAAYVCNDAVHARRVVQRFMRWVESTGMGYVRTSSVDVVRTWDDGRAGWEDDAHDGQTEGS